MKVYLVGRKPLEQKGELIRFSDATPEQLKTCDRIIYGKNWKLKKYITIEELKGLERQFDSGSFGKIKIVIANAFINAKKK